MRDKNFNFCIVHIETNFCILDRYFILANKYGLKLIQKFLYFYFQCIWLLLVWKARHRQLFNAVQEFCQSVYLADNGQVSNCVVALSPTTFIRDRISGSGISEQRFFVKSLLRITDSPKTEMMHSFIPKCVDKTPLVLLKDDIIFRQLQMT